MNHLVHWSYDSPWNPLFGGGGAQRDWEILRRLQGDAWSIDYRVGGFPGCTAPQGDVSKVEFLGSGRGRWSGRIAYAMAAQRRATAEPPREGIWSVSPSIFAPVPAYLAYPERTAVSLFHLVGWGAWRKYGPMGLVAIWHERQILSRMKHFLCINSATASTVRTARPDASVDLVPTGFTPLAEVAPEGNAPLVLFFGRIDIYMKGIDRLLAAFADVGQKIPQAQLTLAGRADAPTLAKVEELLAKHPWRDRIRVEPNPDDRRKAVLFRSATVFCSPSRFEGWCIAAVEAQSCGVPVVASMADGFLDSVDDGISGLLVPNDEAIVPGVAAALMRILRDPGLAARLGAGGRTKAAALTWDAVALRHGEIFQRIAAEAR